jgi:putative DNA primase/helicase
VARYPAVDDQWCGRLVCEWITPSAVTAATAEYFDNQDMFGQWLQQSRDVDLDNHHLMERSTVLLELWADFAKTHGENSDPQRVFNMQNRGFFRKQIRTLGTKGYLGIPSGSAGSENYLAHI